MSFDRIDAAALAAQDPQALRAMRRAAVETGFAVVSNTRITASRVRDVLAVYEAFFERSPEEKSRIDMARTGSNRGWGAPQGEQVNRQANPDYKEVFDCGFQLARDHPLSQHAVYAPNQWPQNPEGFEEVISSYFSQACDVAMDVLRGLSQSLGRPRDSFDAEFDPPMALLRGNFYPPRPAWAGRDDFGIAAHTDYGCLTLLATDGAPGLEVRLHDGTWRALSAAPGEFIINFGEMMEVWTDGAVKATPHRVRGGAQKRLSIPLFFNPSYTTDISPPHQSVQILAGPYLSQRFSETYLHLQDADATKV
ncbi:MAG: isopenicillin N synthase family dioxygenase [Roseobacter sp.]